MGRGRAGAFLGVALGSGLIAFGASHCAEPTQIIVEVRVDPILCTGSRVIRDTGIAVTAVNHIDDEELDVFQSGCSGDSVGRLTIAPRSDDEAAVGIRIVAGVDRPAGDCHGPKWEGCILARRTAQFSPSETFFLTVYLSAECIGKGCGEKECDRGACVDPGQLPADGGKAEPKEDGGPGGHGDTGSDAPIILEAGDDACILCSGTGLSCNDGRTCNIDCNLANCKNPLCSSPLDCVYKCNSEDACRNTRCATSGTCTFNCTGATSGTKCTNIQCASGACNVTCSDTLLACNGVRLDGGKNEVKCTGGENVTCDDVHCSGGRCKRTCGEDAGACGLNDSCEGMCNAWELGNDGGPSL